MIPRLVHYLSRFIHPRFMHGDAGQALPLFAVLMTAFFGIGALTVDVGHLFHEREDIEGAVDAGALAGAQSLPGDAVQAQSKALQYVLANASSLTAADVSITFRCLVGDRNLDGHPDASDIPTACDPKSDASWIVAGGLAVSPCVPANGDKCNVIYVAASTTVAFSFAPVIGVPNGSTGTVTAAACRGACGGPPTTPIDMVVIIDRTGSMSSSDLTNVRTATNTLLQTYDPAVQWVGLGLLGPSRTDASCGGANSPALGTGASGSQPATWVPVGLTGTGAPVNEVYKNANGTLNASSTLVKAINCFNTSSTGTDLSAPIRAASQYLQTHGRANVRKGIILETDGTPNNSGYGPASDYTCSQAAADASTAKSAGIAIVTVGFGLATTDKCPDSSGLYKNASVLQLLADMATTSTNGGCVDAENTDGDNFYCLPKTSQLSGIFQSAANSIAAAPRLLTLPH